MNVCLDQVVGATGTWLRAGVRLEFWRDRPEISQEGLPLLGKGGYIDVNAASKDQGF